MALPSELAEAALLIRTGWSYEDYMATPEHVIQEMLILYRAEAMAQEMAAAEARRGK